MVGNSDSLLSAEGRVSPETAAVSEILDSMQVSADVEQHGTQ